MIDENIFHFTKIDIDNIKKWKKIYLEYSKLDIFKQRIQYSKQIIREFLNRVDGNKSISISGGKDSTVMLHLISTIEKNIKVVTEKDDMDFPGEIEYINYLSKLVNMKIDIIKPKNNLWSVIKNYDFLEDIHSKDKEFSKDFFYNLLKEYKLKNKIKGTFLGLRAEESKSRLWNKKRNGYIYFNKTWNEWVCQPIVNWTSNDIFAYLFKNNIPIFEIYFKNKFLEDPGKIRKSWILPSAQSSEGYCLWLKYYYPEIFYKLYKINPKVRNYV